MRTTNLVSVLAIVAVMMACPFSIVQAHEPGGPLGSPRSPIRADQPASAEDMRDLLAQMQSCLVTVAQAHELMGHLDPLESPTLADQSAGAEKSVRDLLCEPCNWSQWLIAPGLCLAVEGLCGRL